MLCLVALLRVYILLLQLHGYRDDNFMYQNCCVMILLLLRAKYRDLSPSQVADRGAV